MNILFYGTASYDKASFTKELKDYPEIKIDFTETNLTPMTAALARGYDAVCAFVNADCGAMTLEILAGFGVKLLLMRCAGFDAVNVAVAQDLGMKVTRVPAYSPEAIAEHAMGLALAANRRICKGYIRVRENDFSLNGLVGNTLHGKTAGIIGTGRIGATVVRHLRGFGCRVLAFDPCPRDDLAGLATYVTLDELLASSDVVTLHTPGLPENHHMIGAAELARTKRGVVLVNAGRGTLVDTAALVDALESGQVGAAALDTIENESDLYYLDRGRDVLPNRDRAVLSAMPNVIVSPHMAFYTEEDVEGMVRSNVEALLAFAHGEASPYEVI